RSIQVMNTRPKPISRFLIAGLRLVVVALLASFLYGQGSITPQLDRIGLPQDWTHRFVVFSNENSPPDFVLQDPRFWHQYFRRHGAQLSQSSSSDSPLGVAQDLEARNAGQFGPGNGNGKKSPPEGVDWSFDLNGGGV